MKIKLLILLASVMSATSLTAGWTPPAKPDLQAILREAGEDTRAGRHEEALAKYVWFHENALKIDESYYGVRLSFALSGWQKLAEKYPPALVKLKSERDQREAELRSGKATGGFKGFDDIAAINERLHEEAKTRDLFLWLETNQPEQVKNLFNQAQDALIRMKEYKVCGKYLAGAKDYDLIIKSRASSKEIAASHAGTDRGRRLDDFAAKKFSSETRTLVALLVVNERKAEAGQIAALAKKEDPSEAFAQQIEQALQGTVPEPWP